MSKPSVSILTVAVFALMVVLAMFVLRTEGKDRRERDDRLASGAAPTSPRVATERPASSPAPLAMDPGRRASSGRDAGAPLDEASLLSRLHDLAASDPPRSLALAREAAARFPGSANAPELEWNVVKALANMDRYQEAEEEARRMLQRFPGNAFTDDVERHLLNHPPNPPSIPDR